METEILHLVEGAEKAAGFTVIIDVFRAFTLETCAFIKGCEKIVLTGSVEEARQLAEAHPEWLLVGERDGRKVDGFDYGNAPSVIMNKDLKGKTLIHTTTNGVQGIVNAKNADCIMTGSFLNAETTADYILSCHPEHVSLVAMGWKDRCTEEDELCAEYLDSLLHKRGMPDIDQKLNDLRYQEGRKFFNPATQDIFPKEDFAICVERNIFPHAIRVEKENGFYVSRSIS